MIVPNLTYSTALITGAAGFIGFHLSKRLLKMGKRVIGIDNINSYYNPALKRDRLAILQKDKNFLFYKVSLEDTDNIHKIFKEYSPECVVNLAAQAGVRHSINDPYSYADSNLMGFLNILEGCRHFGIKHLVFASSSSVYGANTKMPFSVHHNVDHPVSLYAATKKANELMAHCYSHLYGVAATGLRFFTVYGPWGRPDMALFLFTDAILRGEPISVFNNGEMKRDFTYIDDIVEGVVRVMERRPMPNKDWSGDSPDPGTSYCPYKIYNIGNNEPVNLMDFIGIIEECLNQKAEKNFMPMQLGDVPQTYADIDDLVNDTGFKPATALQDGIRQFIEWYRDYFRR